MHHLAYQVESVDEELARLREAGYELIDTRARPGAHGRQVAFLHPRSVSGTLIELVSAHP